MASPSSESLRSWLESNGTFIHPSLEIKQDPTFGLSTWTTSSLPAETTVISLPFSLAVTPELAERSILALLSGEGKEESDSSWREAVASLEERVKVLVYLVMHWIIEDETSSIDSSSPYLAHYTYLRSLPSPSDLLTPLYFTATERELLQGTSVYGAANEMETTWKADFERVGKVLRLSEKHGFTWPRYLLASTYLSSRAFPSRLLILPPPTASIPTTSETGAAPAPAPGPSHPILLPGIDILNHLPLHPVSWISSPLPSSSSTTNSSSGIISVHLPSPTAASSQIFNNYGAKPNDELLLAYGFVLPSLPYDTSPLLLSSNGIPPSVSQELKEGLGVDVGKRFLVGRDGVIEVGGELRVGVRWLVADEEEKEVMRRWATEEKDGGGTGWWEREVGGENEMNVVELLGEMVGGRLRALRAGGVVEEGKEGEVREEVMRICGIYRQGQIEILEASEQWLEGERDRVAEKYGFDLDEEEEEGEEDQ
ncbi:hypothetical protein BDY24DRAFT_399189 [Mrakia frigida]|uniref:uncharacterized protein n=1 Tax=Mrakia frigida TaxID=29902 RepID=UPI003FCBFD75